jgi:hypothetical protein
MSEYGQIPSTPTNLFQAVQQASDAADQVDDRTTGYVLDNKFAEDRIMDNVRGSNPAMAAASIATGALKGEVCSPHQVSEINKMEKERYDGIPVIQLGQTAVEKAVGYVKGEDFHFGETTTKWVRRVDSFAKAAATQGGSLMADLAVQTARDGKDTIDCYSGEIPKTPADAKARAEAKANPVSPFPDAKADPAVVQVFKAPEGPSIEILDGPRTPAQDSGLVSSYEPQANPEPSRSRAPSLENTGPSM